MTQKEISFNLLHMVDKSKIHSDFASRLNDLLLKKGIGVKELSDIAGVTYEMARRYTLGTAKPRDEKMLKISSQLHVSPAWLDYGIGSSSDTAQELTKNINVSSLTPDEQKTIELLRDLPRTDVEQIIRDMESKRDYYTRKLKELFDERNKPA